MLNAPKLDVIEKQIGQEEILWIAAKSGPKCGGGSVVTSIQVRPRSAGGRGDFIWSDGHDNEKRQDMNEIPEEVRSF